MNVSSQYWSPFHANDCVFSRNEQQKVYYTKIFCFCVHGGAPHLIYPGTSLYEHILWMHLEKNRTYACTFPVQRKEIDVVKVRFTMRYSSRKLSNDKVITTACNFWRQIACSFQVMSGNILFLGSKIFEIPPFFQTRPGDLGKKVHACSLRFSALKPVVNLGKLTSSRYWWVHYIMTFRMVCWGVWMFLPPSLKLWSRSTLVVLCQVSCGLPTTEPWLLAAPR